MGVEHAAKCDDCKEWIDLHKLYCSRLAARKSPFVDGSDIDVVRRDAYWFQRWTWFLLNHWGHKVGMDYDTGDTYYEMTAKYKELWPHDEDCKYWEKFKGKEDSGPRVSWREVE